MTRCAYWLTSAPSCLSSAYIFWASTYPRHTSMASSSLRPMRRSRSSSIPVSGSKDHLSSSCLHDRNRHRPIEVAHGDDHGRPRRVVLELSAWFAPAPRSWWRPVDRSRVSGEVTSGRALRAEDLLQLRYVEFLGRRDERRRLPPPGCRTSPAAGRMQRQAAAGRRRAPRRRRMPNVDTRHLRRPPPPPRDPPPTATGAHAG